MLAKLTSCHFAYGVMFATAVIGLIFNFVAFYELRPCDSRALANTAVSLSSGVFLIPLMMLLVALPLMINFFFFHFLYRNRNCSNGNDDGINIGGHTDTRVNGRDFGGITRYRAIVVFIWLLDTDAVQGSRTRSFARNTILLDWFSFLVVLRSIISCIRKLAQSRFTMQ